MCGFVGVYGPSNFLEDRGEELEACLTHRGPDDKGEYWSEDVALLHWRLSILDLSERGAQPMHSGDGAFVGVYNGEIYNYVSLRDRLQSRGHTFESTSDSEVLVEAFSEWGPGCVNRIEGMFAFAIHDRRDSTLFLTRDRLGIKPLYYARHSGGGLVFGSEIRSVLRTGVTDCRVRQQSLWEYLRYQTVSTPYTLAEGIRAVEPGTYMTFDGRRLTMTRYWNLEEGLSPAGGRSREVGPGSSIEEHVSRAVEKRLQADVPVGVFLSGGVDSSVITVLASKFAGKPIRTLTLVAGEANREDGRYSRRVADLCDTDHHEVRLSEGGVASLVPQALAAQDHPSADGINTFLVSKVARENGLKVALSGVGGDEVFHGYRRSFRWLVRQQQLAWLWRIFPAGVRRTLGAVVSDRASTVRCRKLAQLLASDGSLARTYPLLREFYTPGEVSDLLAFEPISTRCQFEKNVTRALEASEGGEVTAQVSVAEISSYLRDVLLRDADQMGMAHGVEIRVPMLDERLVECALTNASSLGRSWGETKPVLRRIARKHLPSDLVDRPKMGFSMPFGRWMKGPLRSYVENCLGRLGDTEWFNASAVRQRWQGARDSDDRRDHVRVWALVALGRWLERNGFA